MPSNLNCQALTLYQFLSTLLEVWKSIKGNDVNEASSLAQFYVILQQKLPSKVDGSYLVATSCLYVSGW